MVIRSQAAVMTCSSVPTVSLTHIRLVVHKDITDAFAATLILREASDFVIWHSALTSSSATIHGRCRCALARLEAFVGCAHLLGLDNRGLAVGVVSRLAGCCRRLVEIEDRRSLRLLSILLVAKLRVVD